MNLLDAHVAVVATDEAACTRRIASLRARGAMVRGGVVNVNDLATLSAPGFDVVLLDVGSEPDGFRVVARAIDEDPRTARVPVVVVVDPELPIRRVAALGAAHVVTTDAPEARVADVLAELVARSHAVLRATQSTHAAEDHARALLGQIAGIGRRTQTLAHDARALCGLIVGYAANLRDGITGPLTAMQAEHVANVLEAARDVVDLLDRFAGAVRAQLDSQPPPSSIPASRSMNRRTLQDLAELVRTVTHLFDYLAAQKSIQLVTQLTPIEVWCDAMQMKQLVTNLLANALKFTPEGGRVSVVLRAVDSETELEADARRRAELVVMDSGPGVPESERTRIFERGVRLARDEGKPGSGVGLAVVRDVAKAHGASVHVEEIPSGGAAFFVRIPLDMRRRKRRAALLVHDVETQRAVVNALTAAGVRYVDAVPPGDREKLATALQGGASVIVVPPDGVDAFDALLSSDAPSSQTVWTPEAPTK